MHRFGASGAAGVNQSGGQALRSADLLAQLRARNASAAAAGLASADGDSEDAQQVLVSLAMSSLLVFKPGNVYAHLLCCLSAKS